MEPVIMTPDGLHVEYDVVARAIGGQRCYEAGGELLQIFEQAKRMERRGDTSLEAFLTACVDVADDWETAPAGTLQIFHAQYLLWNGGRRAEAAMVLATVGLDLVIGDTHAHSSGERE